MPPSLERVEFETSAADPGGFPEDGGREVAFAGRSNAGKSSALNALTRRKALARTSRTPGRTQLVNFFDLGEGRRLVDLPGYGFAKVPLRVRKQWQGLMEGYLLGREALAGLIVVMDIRHPLTDFDRQMLTWAEASAVPAHCLLTKADKLSRGAARSTLLKVQRQLGDGVTAQTFSATKRDGVDAARDVVLGWLEEPGISEGP